MDVRLWRASSCAVAIARLRQAGSVLPDRLASTTWQTRSAAARSAGRPPAAIVRARISVVAAVAMLGACAATPPVATPSRSLGPGERRAPVANWQGSQGPVICSGGGLLGDFRLRGSADDARLVWMVSPDGSRTELAWPVGYSARFTPGLEHLDDHARVVGTDGTLVTGECPTADPAVLSVELKAPAAPR
jgi:hypothetical protein